MIPQAYFAGEDVRLNEISFLFFSFLFFVFIFWAGLGQGRHYLLIASYINQDNLFAALPQYLYSSHRSKGARSLEMIE